MWQSRKRLTAKFAIVACALWLFIQVFIFQTSNLGRETSESNMANNSISVVTQWKPVSKLLGQLASASARIAEKFHLPISKSGFGEMGRPVFLPAKLQAEAKSKFAINQFNIVVSDLISVNRSLPDYRHSSCSNVPITKELDKLSTSIIIVFHNEAWSTLIRTIQSVLNRSPFSLINEIILVDDASSQAHLAEPLDGYVNSLPVSAKIIRLTERSGLIQARLRGAKAATGITLTFLDAHCEVTTGWLEALLIQLTINPKAVACPIIDVIKDDTFEYVLGSETTWGGFDWRLSFHWYPVSQRELSRRKGDPSAPLRTPAMAGGLFTIRREYFYELGAYDPGMIIWGGENIEFSFRVWQCGGELLIVPCSRVGHVFRKASPYTWPGGISHILYTNTLRTAHVWMDDYKDFFIKASPGAIKIEYGDISERVDNRKRLKCRSFRWYLENIFPESSIPVDFIGLGAFRHLASGRCLDTMGRKSGELVSTSPCHGEGGNQVFAYTEKGEILADAGCLGAGVNRAAASHPVMLMGCHRQRQGQEFKLKEKLIIHVPTQLCLTVQAKEDVHEVALTACNNLVGLHWSWPPPSV